MPTITIAEAARRLNLSRETVRKFIKNGTLHLVRPPGCRPRIEEVELKRFRATWNRPNPPKSGDCADCGDTRNAPLQ